MPFFSVKRSNQVKSKQIQAENLKKFRSKIECRKNLIIVFNCRSCILALQKIQFIMAVRETILRYNLIIQKLRKHPASLEEIQSYLAQESETDKYNLQSSLRNINNGEIIN